MTRRGEGEVDIPPPRRLLERIVGEGVPVGELSLETVVLDVVGNWDFKFGFLKRYKEVRSVKERSDELRGCFYGISTSNADTSVCVVAVTNSVLVSNVRMLPSRNSLRSSQLHGDVLVPLYYSTSENVKLGS